MSSGAYDPKSVEPRIYEFWDRGNYFHAEPDPARKPYTIVIPPPNVTGALHLGHALNNTLQDILIRHARMRGFNAEWMPGTDHAGIATQAVVEKKLRAEQGLTRHELRREGLVKKIWEWKEEYGNRILDQLRKMGCSCDWQRTRFTLDEVCANAVYEAFFRLFKDGLIYRGLRLVNWDAALQTAVADDEIVHETVKGHLWHIRYPIEGVGKCERGNVGTESAPSHGPAHVPTFPLSHVPSEPTDSKLETGDSKLEYLVVATTRPETMLADTAVAVHPDDPRYKHLIGKRVILPLMNRPIPIVADSILVNPEFGTGCVKVTPGHDPNDHACWQRHLGQADEFGIIDLLTPDGRINENGKGTGGASAECGVGSAKSEPGAEATGPVRGRENVGTWEGEKVNANAERSSVPTFPPSHVPTYDYSGMKKEDARKKVVADLEALGLLEKVEPYETQVGHSDRSKTPIEPLRSEQWFVKMDKLAEMAMEAVRDGRVQFFPARYASTYLDWLGEKRDWCISRQLWWGHRIPVWTRAGKLQPGAGLPRDSRVHEQTEVNVENYPLSECSMHTSFDPPSGVYTWYCCPPPNRPDITQALETKNWKQDPDVLDTWFSSSLWPFSTLGWPHSDPRPAGPSEPSPADLDYFFPTDALVTGRGIITLWVARMVMMSLYLTGDLARDGTAKRQRGCPDSALRTPHSELHEPWLSGRVPFRHVVIYPTIQDAQGRTMSKSLGNGVDPLDLIELFGTDAMRFVLCQLATETQDIRMPVKPVKLADGRAINTSDRFEVGRNLCNKLWQAATGLILPAIQATGQTGNQAGTQTDPSLEDRWILSRLSACIAECDRRLAGYEFSGYADALYSFFWNDYCDWYLELVKPRLNDRNAAGEFVPRTDPSAQTARRVLAWVLDQTLRLMHPVMPFITEELWRLLNEAAPDRGFGTAAGEAETEERCSRSSGTRPDFSKPLIISDWPTARSPVEPRVEREMEVLQSVIRALRDIRAGINNLRSAAKQSAIRMLPRAVIRTEPASRDLLVESAAVIKRLGSTEELEIGPDVRKPPDSLSKVLTGIEIYVPIAGLADVEIERKRLRKEHDELAPRVGQLEAKLAGDFAAKAPAAVVEKERERLGEMRARLASIAKNLDELSAG